MTLNLVLMLLAAQMVPPLEPAGKWTIDYGEAACTLARNYGAETAPVAVAVHAMPLAEFVDVMITLKAEGPGLGSGTAIVSIDGGQRARVAFEDVVIQRTKQRIRRTFVPRSTFDGLAQRAVLRVKMPGRAEESYALVGAKPAFEALATCNDTIAKSWGVEPLERKNMARAPTAANDADWITLADYPRSLVGKRRSGTSVILWKIDSDASVAECRIVGTSGVPDLDLAACEAIRRRARYSKPALDISGKPMAVHMIRRVAWRAP